MKQRLLALAIGLVLSSSAWAQNAAPGVDARETVEVSAVRNPALRPYRIMTRGLDAFDKHHGLAPRADLRFELWNEDGTVPSGAGLNLRLAGDHVDLPLAVDGDATFVLPRSSEAFDDDADLVLNRKKTEMQWRPRVRSPGVPDNARRMGDMRLECEVAWAVMKDQMGFVVRNAMALAGGMCRAPMSALYYRPPKRLAAAVLTSGERQRPLTLTKNGDFYIVPLRDRSWDDESLIVYHFADAAPAAEPAPQKEEGAAAP